MVANLKDRGVFVPEEMPPAAFEKMMADRMVKFGAVVKRAGITAEYTGPPAPSAAVSSDFAR